MQVQIPDAACGSPEDGEVHAGSGGIPEELL